MKLYVYAVQSNCPFYSSCVVAARTPTEAKEMMLEDSSFAKEAWPVRCDKVYAKGNPRVLASWSE